MPRVYIVNIDHIFGNLSQTVVLDRLAAGGAALTSRRLANVTVDADVPRHFQQPPPSAVPRRPYSMKCDYRDPACSLHAYMHESVIVEQMAASPYVTRDPSVADFFLVPLPATLFLFYLRDKGHGSRAACEDCWEIERRLLAHLAAGAGPQIAERWSRCGGNEFIFMSLRWHEPSSRTHERSLLRQPSPSTMLLASALLSHTLPTPHTHLDCPRTASSPAPAAPRLACVSTGC